MSGFWGILGQLVVLGAGVASVIYLAPSVATDLRIRDAAPTAGSLDGGKCSNRMFVHICDATLTIQTKDGPVQRDTHIAFFDLHTGDYTASVVADAAHPEWVTTSLALEHLWSRVIVLLAFWAVVLLILFQVVRGWVGILKRALAKRAASPG